MNRDELLVVQAAAMTEAALLDGVLGTPGRPGVALSTGWRGYHTHRSQHSPAGFPDLVLVHARRGRLVFAELKRQAEKYQPTADQAAWLEELDLAGRCQDNHAAVEVYLWRPMDLLDGTITRILARR